MKTPSPESSRLYWVLWADELWKAFSTQAEARHAAKFYRERGCPTYTEGEIESMSQPSPNLDRPKDLHL